jgi:hypothetical protein
MPIAPELFQREVTCLLRLTLFENEKEDCMMCGLGLYKTLAMVRCTLIFINPLLSSTY